MEEESGIEVLAEAAVGADKEGGGEGQGGEDVLMGGREAEIEEVEEGEPAVGVEGGGEDEEAPGGEGDEDSDDEAVAGLLVKGGGPTAEVAQAVEG